VGVKLFGHEQLDVFKVARALAIDIYRETGQFPREERYGLVSQLRRAAVSIPANIAEGAAGRSKKDFARFLLVARGSSTELKLLLDIARETGHLSTSRFLPLDATLERVFSMISGLIRNVTARDFVR
jgi:four helix bundle protein